MSERPRLWLSPDHPSGYVVEDVDGKLWRLPQLIAFNGDARTLMLVRAEGAPAFPTEFFADLVGVAEIASRARVAPGTVHAWRARHADFPDPIAELAGGPVWLWPGVERWLAIKPPPGRPAVRIATPRSPVLRRLRGDGQRRVFELRDRYEPGTVAVEVDGASTMVLEDPAGRRFSLEQPPARGADIKLEYTSILA